MSEAAEALRSRGMVEGPGTRGRSPAAPAAGAIAPGPLAAPERSRASTTKWCACCTWTCSRRSAWRAPPHCWPNAWATRPRARQPARPGPYFLSQAQVRGVGGALPAVAGHLRTPGRRAGGRPHAQQFPAKPDLPGPLPGGDGIRGTGARRSSSSWETGSAWRGWTPTWATSCTARTASRRRWSFTSGAYRAFLEIGDPQDVAISLKNTATCQISLNDVPRSPGHLRTGARLLRGARDAGAGGGGRLQHRLPLLLARRVHPFHRTLPRGARGLPEAGRRLSRGALRPGPVGNVPGAESQRGRRPPGRARAEGLPRTRHGIRSGQGADQPGHFADPPRRHWRWRWQLFQQARRLFDHENNHAWIATIDLYQALVYYRERPPGGSAGAVPARAGILRALAALHQERPLPVAAGPHPPGRGDRGSRRRTSAWRRWTGWSRPKRRPSVTRRGTCWA